VNISLKPAFFIVACTLYLWLSNAFAQLGNNSSVIEQIDPSRIGENLILPTLEKNPLKPVVIQVPIKDNLPLDKKNKKIKFPLITMVLHGNTVFTENTLKKIYSNKINKQISVAELKIIANDITNFYRNSGYILTKVVIPAQEISAAGIVKLQIIEGYINEVVVEGSKNSNVTNMLKSYGRRIMGSRPLKLTVLERYTLFANDIPGANVRAVLTASATTHGAAVLTFVAKEDRIGGSVGFNNYNSSLLGRQQMFASFYANNAIAISQTGVSAALSRNVKQMKFISLQHKRQLNSDGLGCDFNISTTKAKPDLSSLGLASIDLPGQAFNFAVNTYYQMIRSRKQNLAIGGGFKFLNSNAIFNGDPLFKDLIRSINLKLEYDAKDNWLGINKLSISYSNGLNMLGAKADPPSRNGGKTKFSKANFYFARYQRLIPRNVMLVLTVDSQYAFNKLLSAETFGYGGGPFGYGYNSSVITGDHGITGRTELQYQFDMQKSALYNMCFFTFFDRGTVWNINKTLQPTHQTASTAGTGLRFGTYANFNTEFIIAKPLNNKITHTTNGTVVMYFNLKSSM